MAESSGLQYAGKPTPSGSPKEGHGGKQATVRSTGGKLNTAWLILLGLGLLWLSYLWRLHFSWGAETHYVYGWLIPFQAAILLRNRWLERPPAAIPRFQGLILPAVGLCLILLVPVWVVLEVNPFWRLPLWVAGILLVGATFLTIGRFRGWPTALWLAFPLGFLLTMIPWPEMLEGRVIAFFTDLVVLFTVESLRLMSMPALANGNIITIGSTTLGVDEACSGIRSLQALGAMALFVGELMRLRLSGRVVLCLLAPLLSLVFNLGRSLFLAVVAHRGGEAGYDAWHDNAGLISIFLGLGLLLLVALRLRRAGEPTHSKEAGPGPSPIPVAAALGVGLFFLAPDGLSRAWFAFHAGESDEPAYRWTLREEVTSGLEIEELPIRDRVAEILGYDFGKRLGFRLAENPGGELWFYGFTGENPSKSIAAYAHSPNVCMTSSGATLISVEDLLEVDLGPLVVPLRQFVFQLPAMAGGGRVNVFWCLWDEQTRGYTDLDLAGSARTAQLLEALSGRRSFERQVLLVAIHEPDPEKARRLIRPFLRRIVVLERDGEQVFYD